MDKTILVLAMVTIFIAGSSMTISMHDNMALAGKPVPYVVTKNVIIQAGNGDYVIASCNAGDKATGGGFDDQFNPNIEIDKSIPFGNPATGWLAGARNNGVGPVVLDVYAICAP